MDSYTFASVVEIMGVPAPTDKPALEVWHATQPGFGCRIGKARADGKIRRTYLARFDRSNGDGTKTNEKLNLGLVQDIGTGDEVLTFNEAKSKAQKHVEDAKVLARGGAVRLTVGGAYRIADEEMSSVNSSDSPAYARKLRETYALFLAHLETRYLDELDEPYWLKYSRELRAGTLDVGVKVDEAGNRTRNLRQAKSASYALAVMNTASRLYRVAHENKGLVGVAKGWDPTRESAKKVEPPNKRTRFLKFEHISTVWRATDQLMSPWWRDMYRVYLLTGLRDKLVMDMRFDQLDLDAGIYRIMPLQRGTKRRRRRLSEADRQTPIEMPLSTVVVDILRKRLEFAPPGQAGEWVWYSTDTPRRQSKTLPRLVDPRSAWSRLDGRIGYSIYKHDLRRTFASLGATVDPSAMVSLSLLLMHSNTTLAAAVGIPQITADYVQGQLDEMRALTEKISQAVLQLASEAPRTDLTTRLHRYMPLPPTVDRALEVEERMAGVAANDELEAA